MFRSMILVLLSAYTVTAGLLSSPQLASMSEDDRALWFNLSEYCRNGDVAAMNSILAVPSDAVEMRCRVDRLAGRFGRLLVEITNCSTTSILLVDSEIKKLTRVPYIRGGVAVEDWILQASDPMTSCNKLHQGETAIIQHDFDAELPSNYIAEVSFSIPEIISIQADSYEVRNRVIARCRSGPGAHLQ